MTITPSRTAVFVVHLQRDIVGADGAFAGFFRAQVEEREVLAKVRQLTDAAHDAGVLVIWARVAWQPDYSDLHANSALLQAVIGAQCLQEGSAGAELVEDADVREGDVVHTHQRIGGLTPTLERQLRARDIDTVLVCGVATNASVEGTARQFSDAGFRTLVVDEACSAASPEAHQASMESLALVAGAIGLSEAVGDLSA
ncbi:MAG: isochorismatase family cysteine hydrolase [Propionibacteriaceae bacterium]|nr:isochorismatase family cysteine hydrolase [Propionibacteriaceae bacterium]